METVEEPTESAGITSGKRVAHCLTCHHEWQPRDGTTTKPSRCPECKKRTVKWRDLCTPEELQTRKRDTEESGNPVEEPVEIAESEEAIEEQPKQEVVEKPVELVEEKPKSKKTASSMTKSSSSPKPKETGITTTGISTPGDWKIQKITTLEDVREETKGQIAGLPFILLLGAVCALGVLFVLFRSGKKRAVEAQRQAHLHEEQAAKEREAIRARRAVGFGGII